MRSLSHRSPLPLKAPLCVSSMVRFCALQERSAQSGWRLGARVLVTNQRPTHYERVPVRWSRLQSLCKLRVHKLLLMAIAGCRWRFGDISGTRAGHCKDQLLGDWLAGIEIQHGAWAGEITTWRRPGQMYLLGRMGPGGSPAERENIDITSLVVSVP